MPTSHQPDAPACEISYQLAKLRSSRWTSATSIPTGTLPLRVALLLAAVTGILLTALAGSARIMQLRATARKHRRADHRAVKAEAKDSSKARR